jgi:hypothetical protein
LDPIVKVLAIKRKSMPKRNPFLDSIVKILAIKRKVMPFWIL